MMCLFFFFLLFLFFLMKVQTLCNPEKEQFRKVLESCQPSFVYLQGEKLVNEEVGPLVWQGVELSTPEDVSELFGTTLPTVVCDLNFYLDLFFFICKIGY